MTKEEIIQLAYAKNKVLADENGWVKRRVIGHGRTNGMEYEKFGYEQKDLDVILQDMSGGFSWRLKSLRGIENNNGWVKIESDSDLPAASPKKYIVFCNNYIGHFNREDIDLNEKFTFISLGLLYAQRKITHYREVIDIPKPLY